MGEQSVNLRGCFRQDWMDSNYNVLVPTIYYDSIDVLASFGDPTDERLNIPSTV